MIAPVPCDAEPPRSPPPHGPAPPVHRAAPAEPGQHPSVRRRGPGRRSARWCGRSPAWQPQGRAWPTLGEPAPAARAPVRAFALCHRAVCGSRVYPSWCSIASGRQRSWLLDLDEVSHPQLEPAGHAYIDDNADAGAADAFLVFGHGPVPHSQMQAGHAGQPGVGGQSGELADETGQQRRGQVFFLRRPEVIHGAGELRYRAAGGAPHQLFQTVIGKPGRRRCRQRSREEVTAGVDRRGKDVQQPFLEWLRGLGGGL